MIQLCDGKIFLEFCAWEEDENADDGMSDVSETLIPGNIADLCEKVGKVIITKHYLDLLWLKDRIYDWATAEETDKPEREITISVVYLNPESAEVITRPDIMSVVNYFKNIRNSVDSAETVW